MIRPLLLLCAALSCGCDTTTVNFITEVMPGRTANLDVENRELTLSRGAAIKYVSSQLGHESAAFTMTQYIHFLPENEEQKRWLNAAFA